MKHRRRDSFFNFSINELREKKYSLVSRGTTLNFWDPTNGKWKGSEALPKNFKYNIDNFQSKNCQLSEKEIILGDSSGCLFFVNLFNDTENIFLKGHSQQIRALECGYRLTHLDSNFFISGSEDDTILLWKIEPNKRKIVYQIEEHSNAVIDITFITKNCTHYASTSMDRTLKIFDTSRRNSIHSWDDQSGYALCSIEDKQKLFSASSNKSIREYHLNEQKAAYEICGFDDNVMSIIPIRNESNPLLVCCDNRGTFYSVDLRKTNDFLWKEFDPLLTKSNRIILNDGMPGSFLTCKNDLIECRSVKTGKLNFQVKETESIFGIFLFENKNFEKNEVLVKKKSLLKIRNDFVKNEDVLNDESYFNEDKSVMDWETLNIDRQITFLKSKECTQFHRNIYKAYATLKNVESSLQFYANQLKLELDKYVSLLSRISSCIEFTLSETRRNEVNNDLFLTQYQPCTESKLSQNEFQKLKEFVSEIETNEKEIKNYIKGGWKAFHVYRQFIHRNLGVLKCGIQCIENFNEDKKLVYVGETFRKNLWKPHGRGFLYRKKRKTFTKIYEGSFVDGKRHGEGISFEESEGRIIYEGNFSNDVYHGAGALYNYKTRKCTVGTWENGEGKEEESVDIDFELVDFAKLENRISANNLIESKQASGKCYRISHGKNKKCVLKVLDFGLTDVDKRERIKRALRRKLLLLISLSDPYIAEIYAVTQNIYSMGFIMKEYRGTIEDILSDYCEERVTGGMEKNKKSLIPKLEAKDKFELLKNTSFAIEAIQSIGVRILDLNWSHVFLKDEKEKGNQPNEVVVFGFDYWFGNGDLLWRNNMFAKTFTFPPPFFAAPETFKERNYIHRNSIVFSFAMMIYSLLFNCINPYRETDKCKECGEELFNISPDRLGYHINECNLRPFVSEGLVEKVVAKDYWWIIDLMKICWVKQPILRPSIEEIVKVFNDPDPYIFLTIQLHKFGMEKNDEVVEFGLILKDDEHQVDYSFIKNKIEQEKLGGRRTIQKMVLRNRFGEKQVLVNDGSLRDSIKKKAKRKVNELLIISSDIELIEEEEEEETEEKFIIIVTLKEDVTVHQTNKGIEKLKRDISKKEKEIERLQKYENEVMELRERNREYERMEKKRKIEEKKQKEAKKEEEVEKWKLEKEEMMEKIRKLEKELSLKKERPAPPRPSRGRPAPPRPSRGRGRMVPPPAPPKRNKN